jgi:transketolase
LSITRCIPKLVVLAPGDAHETRKATIAAAEYPGPVYIRFTREKTPVFTTPETPFEIGKAVVLRDGTDVAIIGCGPLVYNALLAAEALSHDGINCRVIDNHSVKPMDENTILAAARECGAIVTVEEHQVQGGMGSRVAEIVVARRPVPIEFIGVHDRFGQSGEPNDLIEHYGMGVTHIIEAVKKVFNRKIIRE